MMPDQVCSAACVEIGVENRAAKSAELDGMRFAGPSREQTLGGFRIVTDDCVRSSIHAF